ncbi:hypothetical protein [Komagataeibacter xylinus]|uniref:hypothetical protein n=1 Tax=Komagataeibacter xylinus TaxID=28448 RepID=UPI001013D588|nr:hypothetical protein [Komagataeibacter xylinus]
MNDRPFAFRRVQLAARRGAGARAWGGVALAGLFSLCAPAWAQAPVRYAEGILNAQIEEGAFWIHHGDDDHARHALAACRVGVPSEGVRL